MYCQNGGARLSLHTVWFFRLQDRRVTGATKGELKSHIYTSAVSPGTWNLHTPPERGLAGVVLLQLMRYSAFRVYQIGMNKRLHMQKTCRRFAWDESVWRSRGIRSLRWTVWCLFLCTLTDYFFSAVYSGVSCRTATVQFTESLVRQLRYFSVFSAGGGEERSVA